MSIDACARPFARDARGAAILVCLQARHDALAASSAARSEALSSVPSLTLPFTLNFALLCVAVASDRTFPACMRLCHDAGECTTDLARTARPRLAAS